MQSILQNIISIIFCKDDLQGTYIAKKIKLFSVYIDVELKISQQQLHD